MTIIKICGIKTLPDALAAIEAGADYLGFNFYPKSVRFIEKDACAKITSVLRREHPHIKLVGVFVNASVEEVQEYSRDLLAGFGATPRRRDTRNVKAACATSFQGFPRCARKCRGLRT